ncbi:hypothetical protein LguiA_010941 [Lonicera macranthoides]
MSLCKNSVHSFLGFSNSKDNLSSSEYLSHRNHHHPAAGGLTFFSVFEDVERPVNVLESATIKKHILESTPKRHPGSIGFLDEVGGSVDGLMSCTEGLGFESSDERRVDDQILNTLPSPLSSKTKKTVPFKKEAKKFPPPLSSLNNNGQPKFILRPVRKEGRLELTEVKIHQPDVLHASRQDGRLRLHFVFDKDEEAENQIEEEKQVTIQEDAKEFQENVEEEKLEEERVEEEEGLKIPVMGRGGDGFRRHHELVASHHCRHRRYHDYVWSQRCVTIA